MDAQNVKGTRDVLANESHLYHEVENFLIKIATLFGYNEIRTPILENSEVFSRGVGESSDIVRKEMYTFLDKGNRSVTMRPEFTAGIVRSFVQNKMYATEELPVKLFYHGPAFRYERPQLGRFRQFTQFGVESLGNNSLYNDAEVIVMAITMLQSLGLENVKLKINCLGDEESRNNYREALKAYFKPLLPEMCEDCKQRYEINPLRILDCKVPHDHELALKAPKISDYLSENSKNRFDALKSYLDMAQVKYELDDQLVRGLDYYSEIVFEFSYVSKEGKDYGALGGGGHYSNLIKELGGPDLPGVGFSFGIERLIDVLKDDRILIAIPQDVDIYVMPLDAKYRPFLLNLVNMIRLRGYRAEICFDDAKVGSMLKRANKKGVEIALLYGENEFNNKVVTLKNLKTGEQQEVPLDKLLSFIDNYYRQGGTCACGGSCGDDCNGDCSGCQGGNN